MFSMLAFALVAPPGPSLASLESCNRLAAKVVSLLNKGDAAELSLMATPEFFETIPKDRFPGLVSQVHSFGVLSKPELILDLTEQRRYLVKISKPGQPDMPILLSLGAESDSKFYSLVLGQYRSPVTGGHALNSDNPEKTLLDQEVQAAVDGDPFKRVGMSIGIIRDGKARIYNFGEAKDHQLPNSDTVYEIGSITKTMTGFLLSQAIKEGKANLDDDVRKYLAGSFPNLQFEGKPVTLGHLVTHTSGLPGNPPGIPDDAKADAYERYSHEALLTDLASVKLVRAPGTAFGYSNMGGGLVGLVLERIYGQPFSQLLQSDLFIPLKMTHTGIGLSPWMELHYATPYDSRGSMTDRWTVNGIESAGAVRSTISDMMKFAVKNLDERNSAVQLSHTTQSKGTYPNFGIFWMTGTSRLAGHYVKHEGGTGGFSSHILIMPAKKLAVVILTNGGEQPTGDLAYEIALRVLSSN